MELWWIVYLLMGLFVGFFAGLLGIGGGLILVTLMVYVFTLQGFPSDRLLHLALGTSIASIVFTSISSLRAHHKHGAVRWDILRTAVPGLIIGTLLGTIVADQLKSKYLAIFFVVFVYYSAVRMFVNVKPKPTRQLPGKAGMTAAAVVVGIISSLVGHGTGQGPPAGAQPRLRLSTGARRNRYRHFHHGSLGCKDDAPHARNDTGEDFRRHPVHTGDQDVVDAVLINAS